MMKSRERMIQDMQLHGYALRTQQSYANAVEKLAQFYNKSPEQLEEEDIRNFFLYLINEKKASRSNIKVHLCGIKFFYEKTLRQHWNIFDLTMPKKDKNFRLSTLVKKLPPFLNRSGISPPR